MGTPQCVSSLLPAARPLHKQIHPLQPSLLGLLVVTRSRLALLKDPACAFCLLCPPAHTLEPRAGLAGDGSG